VLAASAGQVASTDQSASSAADARYKLERIILLDRGRREIANQPM
jgi:hypothetical protein